MSDESEDEPFDLESYEWTEEAANRTLNNVVQTYFPMPGCFSSFDNVDVHYDQLERMCRARGIGQTHNDDDDDEDDDEDEDERSVVSQRSVSVGNNSEGPWQPGPIQFGELRSSLTAEKQAEYVDKLRDVQKGEDDHLDDVDFQKTRKIVVAESEQFTDFVANSCRRAIVKANNFMPVRSKEYILQCLRAKSGIINSIPGRYAMSMIQYVFPEMADAPTLDFECHLRNVGEAPGMVVPNLMQKITVPMQAPKKIESQYPRADKASEGVLANDPNLSPLIGKHNVEFVVSASAMRSLILWRGPLLADDCELPVNVVSVGGAGSQEKVVIVSKPLPPRDMLPRQLMTMMAKYALKAKLCYTNSSKGRDRTGPEEVASPSPARQRSRSLSAPAKLVRIRIEDRVFLPGESSPVEVGCARQYSLWKLRNHRILLRSNLDGYRVAVDSEQLETVSVSAKVEYQPSYGAEMQTSQEKAYEWLTGYLKQADVHLRGRIKHNADHDLLGLDTLNKEYFKLENLSEECRQLVAFGLLQLEAMFGDLINLVEGTYLLSMKSGDRSYTLYQPASGNAVNESSSKPKPDIDVFKCYNAMNWLKIKQSTFDQCSRRIDPDVVLLWQQAQKRAPGTFPPRRDENGESLKKSPMRKRHYSCAC